MKILGDTLPRLFKAKASGAITAGKPCIVEADGDVAQIVSTTVTEALGSAVVFQSQSIFDTSVVYDVNADRVVIAYRNADNSNYGTAVVGTVSGTSISFGTPVVFESALTNSISAAYDANAQKIVIAYRDEGNSSYGTAIIGTVSGTSISFGTPVVYASVNASFNSAVYDSNAQKIVIGYKDNTTNNYGYGIVGTVSGTSISFGSATAFESANTFDIGSAFDSTNNKVVLAYRDAGNSSYGTAIVGTVSGTSISFGTAEVFDSSSVSGVSVAYDVSAQKIVIAYKDTASGLNEGEAVVGTVSGTSISFGTPAEFDARSNFISAAYDATAQKVVIAYEDADGSDYGKVVVCTISGTSVTFSTPYTFESASTGSVAAAYNSSAEKVVIGYRDEANSGYGTGIVYQTPYTSTNLTSENYIGIAEYAASDTETATVLIKGGVSTTQSSLTPGQTYFVQTDGTIGTSADSPSVTAGTAVTSTKLIVKG
tara:strand:- start:1553 stop:3001 length:1449 start_codon:yes stop_codon:yes gene_type:complete